MKRYDQECRGGDWAAMVEDPDGEWIRADDALKRIAELEHEIALWMDACAAQTPEEASADIEELEATVEAITRGRDAALARVAELEAQRDEWKRQCDLASEAQADALNAEVLASARVAELERRLDELDERERMSVDCAACVRHLAEEER